MSMCSWGAKGHEWEEEARAGLGGIQPGIQITAPVGTSASSSVNQNLNKDAHCKRLAGDSKGKARQALSKRSCI